MLMVKANQPFSVPTLNVQHLLRISQSFQNGFWNLMLDEELFNDTANTFVCSGEAFFWRMTRSMISWKESFSWVHIIFRQIVVSSESLKNKINVVISYHPKSSARSRFYQVPIFSWIWLVRACRKVTWTEWMKSWKLTESKIDYYRPFCLLLRNAEKIMSLLVVFYVEIRQKVPKIATNSFSIADMILVTWKTYFQKINKNMKILSTSAVQFRKFSRKRILCPEWNYRRWINLWNVKLSEFDHRGPSKIEEYFSWTKVGQSCSCLIIFQSEKCDS